MMTIIAYVLNWGFVVLAERCLSIYAGITLFVQETGIYNRCKQ